MIIYQIPPLSLSQSETHTMTITAEPDRAIETFGENKAMIYAFMIF